MTKIAIVGANGKVGTELCFHLRAHNDIEVVPIVRNKLGSAFLNEQGFTCRIADVCSESDAEQALRDIDVVVIASYVFLAGRDANLANRSMIENSTKYSLPEAKILYLSSVRALAWRVDKATRRFSVPRGYDRNKRLMERYLLKKCAESRKIGLALRLGHVFGKNQPRTRTFEGMFESAEALEVRVRPEAPSNVVHTETIADCIVVCARSSVLPGVYSVVNVPQWSWKEVFDYYNRGGVDIFFKEQTIPPFHRRLLKAFWRYAIAHRRALAELRQFAPHSIDRRLKRRFAVRRAGAEIAPLNGAQRNVVEMREFAYRPMPEKFLPGLTETRSLLREETLPTELFR